MSDLDLDNIPRETTLSSELIVQDGITFHVLLEDGLFYRISMRGGNIFDKFVDGGREAVIRYMMENYKISRILATDLVHGWFREEAKKRYSKTTSPAAK